MLYYENIQKAMGVEIAESQEMADAVLLWNRMYRNKAPWLNAKLNIRSLDLASAVCSEMANAVTMEAQLSVEGGNERAVFLDSMMQKVFSDLPYIVEFAAAGGGLVLKPYVAGRKIFVDYVRSDSFFPVTFDSAWGITAAIFPEYLVKGKWLFTRLEYHAYNETDGTYQIINKAFKSKKAAVKTNDVLNLGHEVGLSEVAQWTDIEPEILLQGADRPLFAYLKVPMANNVDPDSPLGVSLYARAVNDIRDADEQYGGILWEFRSKETAVQAGSEFFDQDREGHSVLPKGKERLYHDLGDVVDKTGTPFFNVYSPEIRDQSFFNGLNRILRRVEFNCRLAYGTISDPQQVDKTAEEVKSSKQRTYSMVKAFQTSTYNALSGLLGAMDAWVDIAGFAPAGKVELKSNWDDSVIVDKDSERKSDRADVAMGAMPVWEYRMKWYREDEETAKRKVGIQEDVIVG